MDRETIRELSGTIAGACTAFAVGGLAFSIAPVGAVGVLTSLMAKGGILMISSLAADAGEKSMMRKVDEIFEDVDRVKAGLEKLKKD